MNTSESFQGKSVLVTGACGTVGAALVEQLVAADAGRIVCLDNNETELFFLQQKYRKRSGFECYIADIRSYDALAQRMAGIEVVLHAAALKHVGLCEDAPNEAIKTNIIGCQNVIAAAEANKVSRVIFTSSDKAVNPTNVMGTTKLMGERLFTAAAAKSGPGGPIFASTRFGNILGSRGSVIPLFYKQIKQGGPITLTDREMTRFIMHLPEAASLVLKSVWLSMGGEVFVTKMPVARIEKIAEQMRDRLTPEGQTIEITEIGAKPGEKLYEELMNEEEVRRAYEIDNFLVIIPAFVRDHAKTYPYIADQPAAHNPYNSHLEDSMSDAELQRYLTDEVITSA